MNNEIAEEAEAAEAALGTTIRGDVAGAIEALLKHAQDAEDPALATKAMTYLRRSDLQRLAIQASRNSQESEDRLVAILSAPLMNEATPEPVFLVAARTLFQLRRFSREPPKPKKEAAGESGAASGAGADDATLACRGCGASYHADCVTQLSATATCGVLSCGEAVVDAEGVAAVLEPSPGKEHPGWVIPLVITLCLASAASQSYAAST